MSILVQIGDILSLVPVRFRNEKAVTCSHLSGRPWGRQTQAGESSGRSEALQEQFCWGRDCMGTTGVLPKRGTWLLQVLSSIQGWLDNVSCFSYTEGWIRWCHLILQSMNPGFSTWQCCKWEMGADPWQSHQALGSASRSLWGWFVRTLTTAPSFQRLPSLEKGTGVIQFSS